MAHSPSFPRGFTSSRLLQTRRWETERANRRIRAPSGTLGQPAGSVVPPPSPTPRPARQPRLRPCHGPRPSWRRGSAGPAPLPLPACPRSPRRVTGGRPRPLAASAEADGLHGSIHPNQLRQLELVLTIADLICSFQRIRGNQIPLCPFEFAMFCQMSNCQLQKSSYGHTQL